MPEAQQAGRSYGRWYILGVICLMYLITYLDRVVMSNTAPEISPRWSAPSRVSASPRFAPPRRKR